MATVLEVVEHFGYMGVAVVTADVMHTFFVGFVAFGECLVESGDVVVLDVEWDVLVTAPEGKIVP